MSNKEQAVQVYQLRVWIREISPQIWRRLLVRSDSTIAQLHDTLQIAFGWTDEHLHQFLIRGKPYGIGDMEASASTTIRIRYDCVTSTSAPENDGCMNMI